MGKLIPFFYYDIFARVIPGAATIATLVLFGIKPPPVFASLFSDNGTGINIIISILCLGASYIIGLLNEILFSLPGISDLYHFIADLAFKRQCKKLGLPNIEEPEDLELDQIAWKNLVHKGDILPTPAALEKEVGRLKKTVADTTRKYRHKLWNQLLHKCTGDNTPIFQHVHRFQAEAKMCLHSLIPVFLMMCWFMKDLCNHGCTQQWYYICISIAVFLILLCGAYKRESRRWLQVLIAKENFLDIVPR